mmetsp:Transcript_15396/g.39719  ORF Transcript_15396/g.39719 Transcript_15396/m.39719 type:complete len:396 (+) Transcript_15396:235-1422(+)
MGNCLDRRAAPSSRGVRPELFTALYDHNAPGKLRFRKGDTLIVIGREDKFTLLGHVQGERATGTFPSTYVVRQAHAAGNPTFEPRGVRNGSDSLRLTPVSSRRATEASGSRVAAQRTSVGRGSQPSAGGFVFVSGKAAPATDDSPSPGTAFVAASSSRQRSPTVWKPKGQPAPPPPRTTRSSGSRKRANPPRSCLKGAAPLPAAKQQARAKGIRFAKRNPPAGTTHHTADYERAADFNPMRAQEEWEKEEEAEMQRMLEFRWYIMERDLPPGTRCPERVEFEEAARQRAEQEARQAAREAREKEERRRRFREARATKRKQAEQARARTAAALAGSSRGPPVLRLSDGTALELGGDLIAEPPRRRSAMAAGRPQRLPPAPPRPALALATDEVELEV